MSSQLLVTVCQIRDIQPIQGADRVELAMIGGWQCMVGKGQHKIGDAVVYVPPDAILPGELSDRLGVTRYLDAGRVRTQKFFKGKVISMGLVIANEGGWLLGEDVKAHYGITKYEPPIRSVFGGGPGTPGKPRFKNDPRFRKYSSPENLRYYIDAFLSDERVIVTEKIHGSNVRLGLIGGEWMAGSHEVQRIMPIEYQLTAYKGYKKTAIWTKYQVANVWGKIHAKIGHHIGKFWQAVSMKPVELIDGTYGNGPRFLSIVHKAARQIRKIYNKFGPGFHMASYDEAKKYWYPYTVPEVKTMLEALSLTFSHVMIFGELYGADIQKLDYGVPSGKLDFIAFDLMIDEKYVDYDAFATYCTAFNVKRVPVLYDGPYTFNTVKHHADGNTTLASNHIREGVVVKSAVESTHPAIGRKILKYISNAYLAWKDGREAEVDSTDI